MAKHQMWYTQKILFPTSLFGKYYFWMEDVDGTIYLAKAKPIYANSIQAKIDDGELSVVDAEHFIEGYSPDLT